MRTRSVINLEDIVCCCHFCWAFDEILLAPGKSKGKEPPSYNNGLILRTCGHGLKSQYSRKHPNCLFKRLESVGNHLQATGGRFWPIAKNEGSIRSMHLPRSLQFSVLGSPPGSAGPTSHVFPEGSPEGKSKRIIFLKLQLNSTWATQSRMPRELVHGAVVSLWFSRSRRCWRQPSWLWIWLSTSGIWPKWSKARHWIRPSLAKKERAKLKRRWTLQPFDISSSKQQEGVLRPTLLLSVRADSTDLCELWPKAIPVILHQGPTAFRPSRIPWKMKHLCTPGLQRTICLVIPFAEWLWHSYAEKRELQIFKST